MESFCSANRRTNVASFNCDQARKFPSKLLIGAAEFDEADAIDDDTFKAALIAASELDTGTEGKLFPIHTLRDPAETTEANKTGAVGEGPVQVLVEGKPSFTYRVEIGQDLFKRLRVLNKQVIPIFTYDDASNLWGAKSSTGKFVGCPAMFFISGNTQQTASTPVSALISISYMSAVNYNDEAFYVPVTLGELEPLGLLDAYLAKISNATNVYKYSIKAPTAKYNGFINIAAKYNAVIDDSVFTAFTGATFSTPLTITSVAYDSTLEAMTVTYDSTAYTALAALAKIKLFFGAVADLKVLGIDGIEGVPVTVVK